MSNHKMSAVRSREIIAVTKKTKPLGPRRNKNISYFTQNNSRFVSRRIPTLQEMIVERHNQPRTIHECKLHTSWPSIQSQDKSSSQTLIDGDGKSIPHGQTSPSTISFATLYKATSTAKSELPTFYEKNPYYKYILEQKRLVEKCRNVEEEQLEGLEKENEEEILKIAKQFCKKVQTWDEDDTTVADAIQSLNMSQPEGGNPSDAVAQATLQQDKLEKVVITHDLSHLTNPEWVADLFRICFGTPWSNGLSKVLKEKEGTKDICHGLNIPVEEMRRQRIKVERVEADRILKKRAAMPKIAFGRSVPRAKGLEDYEKSHKTPSQRRQEAEDKKQQDLMMDLVTMKVIWGNQLNSLSTKHYCKHLRELIRQKIAETSDPSLAEVTLQQMKPKVLVDAGLLSMDSTETASESSSLSSVSSSSSTPHAPAQKNK